MWLRLRERCCSVRPRGRRRICRHSSLERRSAVGTVDAISVWHLDAEQLPPPREISTSLSEISTFFPRNEYAQSA